jgi:hypothetical protein
MEFPGTSSGIAAIFVGGFRIYMSMPSVAPGQDPKLAAAESFARTWVIDCYFA